ncbi:MAG: site-2 protease family protein [Anaerolineae bacterium]|jgi:membrane-associated protease RseP (regulator of RpoE activity)
MAATTFTEQTMIERLRRPVSRYMAIEGYEIVRSPDAVIVFRGRIGSDTEAAFDGISEAFERQGYTARLHHWEDDKHEVFAIQGVQEGGASRPWLNLVLFLGTVLTVLYIGAQKALLDADMTIDLMSPQALWMPLRYLHLGIPFAATLMSILVAHELSHYFVARRYGSPVSLPYFIPMPNLLGTMGAVITQKAPMRDRKALFDIGIAGPLGGLILTIPLLVLGLALSNVQPPPTDLPPGVGILQEGNSLLYAGLKYLVFGEWLPSNGRDVWLHPVAFAAWAGLLVTMINLIPVGQLDGGHVTYALLGRRAWTLGYGLIVAMFGWGGWLLLNGNQAGSFWLMWGFLNMLLNRKHPPPLNDVTELDGRRVAIGVLMLVIFILTFMPSPLREIPL